jgi:carbon storage regulator
VIVIPRKKGESVVINDDIILTVIEVRGDKVRLGIEHPKGVTVHRREIYEAILNQQEVGQGTKPQLRLEAWLGNEAAQTMPRQKSLSFAASAGAKHAQE